MIAPPKPTAPVPGADIPAPLLALKQWVVWRYEIRDDEWTKVPYTPGTGQRSNSSDSTTWRSYTEAANDYDANLNKPCAFDGIRFAFSAEDDFCGIDLDDSIDPQTGELRPWAKRLADMLDSYTEISPSDEGVKIWIHGRLPEGCRKRRPVENGGIEFYDSKRYFTVTGQRLPGTKATVEDRQEQLNQVLQSLNMMPKPKEEQSPRTLTPVTASDAEILQVTMRAKDGEKFKRLWEGDTSAYSGDDSRADLALCGMLGFWTGGDRSRIDVMFRQSGLYRSKWEREDYRNRTINKALEGRTEFYQPHSGNGQGTKPPARGGSSAPAHELETNPPKPASYTPKLFTDAEFVAAQFPREWLVKRVLAKGQLAVCGGPKKSLKTSVLVDLVLSLGTGTPFLDRFDVPKPVRVIMLSGESGEATLQETRNRIARAKGIASNSPNIFWGAELPQLSNALHLVDLAALLKHHQVEVAVFDPLYLCLLSGADPDKAEASNYYQMGPLFQRISKTCLEVGCTPILAPHAKKHQATERPIDLDDLAFAGVAEFARQWILLNRREEYRGDGKHSLHLSIGGSAGQSFFGRLGIEEGELKEDFSGREWHISIESAIEVKASRQAERDQQQAEQDHADDIEVAGLIDRLSPDPATPPTLNRLNPLTGISRPRTIRALQRLIDGGDFCRKHPEVACGRGRKQVVEAYYRKEQK